MYIYIYIYMEILIEAAQLSGLDPKVPNDVGGAGWHALDLLSCMDSLIQAC